MRTLAISPGETTRQSKTALEILTRLLAYLDKQGAGILLIAVADGSCMQVLLAARPGKSHGRSWRLTQPVLAELSGRNLIRSAACNVERRMPDTLAYSSETMAH